MKQKKFTFSKHFAKSYLKNYQHVGFITHEDAFRAAMLRQGYLIQNVKAEETITVSCVAARANIPLKEREKLQKKIKMPNKIYLPHLKHE